jgi:hypothetical protein
MTHETEHARMSLEGALIDVEQYLHELPTVEEIRTILAVEDAPSLPTVEEIRTRLSVGETEDEMERRTR